MSVKAIKDRLSRRPFEPFRVIMSSGDSYEVRHPELAFLLRNGLYVAEPTPEGQVPEDATWCGLLHIAAIESLTAASTGQPSNGDKP
jgi:hypothetical protein